jgi:hypothetical protein
MRPAVSLWRKAQARELHIMPGGELDVWTLDDKPDALLFAIHFLDEEYNWHTYSVPIDRDRVRTLDEHLRHWLSSGAHT